MPSFSLQSLLEHGNGGGSEETSATSSHDIRSHHSGVPGLETLLKFETLNNGSDMQRAQPQRTFQMSPEGKHQSDRRLPPISTVGLPTEYLDSWTDFC